jgi:hypothetical protein
VSNARLVRIVINIELEGKIILLVEIKVYLPKYLIQVPGKENQTVMGDSDAVLGEGGVDKWDIMDYGRELTRLRKL